MVRELAENNFTKDFGQEREVWHWSLVFQDLGGKSCFLEKRLNDRWFESRWEKAVVQRVVEDRCEVLKKIVKRSRLWVRKDVCRGSSSHVFIVDWLSIFFIYHRDRLKGTPDRATKMLIGYRGHGHIKCSRTPGQVTLDLACEQL